MKKFVSVRVSNIGNRRGRGRTVKGRSGDLRSKYYPTLTVVSEAKWEPAVRRKEPDGLVYHITP